MTEKIIDLDVNHQHKTSAKFGCNDMHKGLSMKCKMASKDNDSSITPTTRVNK